MTADFSSTEVTCRIVRETDKGVLIDDGDREVWLPKGQVTDNRDGTISIPEWLAIRTGLV